jgi:xylan 1,4-beta-xylosidase
MSGMKTMCVSLDVRRDAGRFPKYWSRCFGAERGGFFLRKDVLDHHRLGVEAFGNEFVRFHGILHDDVGIAQRGHDGKVRYQWFNLERIYDNILDLGMRPFVEFSFMPAPLASGDQTIFYWKGNVTLPKSFTEWEELIEAFVRRMRRRYGPSETRKWYWEVWNEPNLRKWFFAGSMEDYFRLYDHAAVAVKRVDPRYRVGGPATACGEWIREMIEHCRKSNLARPSAGSTPLDFVSTHLYPGDPFFMENEKMDLKWKGEAFFRETIARNHRIVRSYPAMGLEMHMTEWNCSSNSRDPIHDGPNGAAFAVKAIQEVAGNVDTFSWWTLTDIFEEGGQPPAAFHGGFGLMTVDGLKKPSWRAFECMADMGTRLLAKPVTVPGHAAGLIPTAGDDGSARLLFWSFHLPGTPRPPSRAVELVLTGLPRDRRAVTVELFRIDEGHANIRREWERMGSPQSLDARQRERLLSLDRFEPAETRDLAVKGGIARHRFTLPVPGVAYAVVR